MIVSAMPLVYPNARSKLVVRVREVLNIPGGDELDEGLQQMLRWVQQKNNLRSTGCIDYATLDALGLYDK